jgi:hypothetical protein
MTPKEGVPVLPKLLKLSTWSTGVMEYRSPGKESSSLIIIPTRQYSNNPILNL